MRQRFRWLLGWLGWRPDPVLEHLHFFLYTREGCHLCEAAERTLAHARRSYRFKLTIEDIDANPELKSRYGSQVPVVLVNGKIRFRGGINVVLLNRFLQAEAKQRARAKRKDHFRGRPS